MADLRHFNLFPFCVWPSKQAYIEETFMPPTPTVYEDFDNETETIVADLNTIMALYWRVKKWRAFGIFEYYATRKVSTNYEFIFTRNAATEADLACLVDDENQNTFETSGFLKQFTRTGNPINLSLPSGSVTFSVSLALPIFTVGASANRPVIKQSNDLYSTGIYFVSTIEEGSPSADEYYFASIFRAPFKTSSPSFPEADPPNSTVPLSFLGKTYNMLAYKIEPVIELPDNSTTILEISLAINAIEYWEYDPNDGGGPIYNSATGAQLRPFP